MAAAVRQKLDAFWTGPEQRSKSLVAALIALHLPVTQSDLDDWEDDPEAWFHANEGVLLEHELRGISEIVLRVCLAVWLLRVTSHHHSIACRQVPLLDNGKVLGADSGRNGPCRAGSTCAECSASCSADAFARAATISTKVECRTVQGRVVPGSVCARLCQGLVRRGGVATGVSVTRDDPGARSTSCWLHVPVFVSISLHCMVCTCFAEALGRRCITDAHHWRIEQCASRDACTVSSF